MNDGFVLEEHRLRDINNPAAGTIPFRRRYQTPVDLRTRQAEDRDFAVYVQDSWRPNNRLTFNLGLRADFVKRNDKLFDIVRQNSARVRPAVRVLLHADQRRPHRAARQRRAGPRAGDGP